MSSKHDSFCSVCRTLINSEEESVFCYQCQYQFHTIHLGYWVKANGDCPNCKTEYSSTFVDELLFEINSLTEELEMSELLMSNYWTTSSCLVCNKTIYINEDECRCLNCGRDSHLNCILDIAPKGKFPTVDCPDCGHPTTPLTHMIDNLVKREQFTQVLPQENIWFPQYGFAQLHFHNNGSTIDYLKYEVQRKRDTYPRYIGVYLNNSLYSNSVISGGRKDKMTKIPNNITKVTLQINFGAWKEHGWLLSYISDDPSYSYKSSKSSKSTKSSSIFSQITSWFS